MNVKVELSQGPVHMTCLEGRGLDAEYYLWDEIFGHEFFPKSVGSANYVLTLRKSANHYDEVSRVEGELASALTRLCEVWVFSGGSLFPILEEKIISRPLYSSNAQTIEKELLSTAGKTKVVSSSTTEFECGCTYSNAPLKNAIKICSAAISRLEIQRIIKYYSDASLNSEKWFVDLYKVRDSIKLVYGSGSKAREALNINKHEWSFFGKVLNNNDLRHAPKDGGTTSTIRVGEKNKVKSLAKEWVLSLLKYENII